MASTTMAKTLESGQISLNPESTARDLTVYPDAHTVKSCLPHHSVFRRGRGDRRLGRA